MNNHEPIVYSKENTWQEDSKSVLKSLIALGFESAHFKLPFSAFRFNIEEFEEQKVYANFIKLEEELQLWNSTFFQRSSNEIVRLRKSEKKLIYT